jgi:signal transduction histidine kinase
MVKGLADEAVNLPWLAPRAASLVALAGAPGATVWERVRADPGLVLLMVRHALPPPGQYLDGSFSTVWQDTRVLDAARDWLRRFSGGSGKSTGFADWSRAELQPIYGAALRCARAAEILASQSQRCDPELAWVGGLLAPLSWMALAAISPRATVECLAECRSSQRPADVQRQSLGMEASAIARRLSERWQLPAWLVSISGYLALPADVTLAFNQEPDLFRIVQIAAAWLDAQPDGLALTGGLVAARLCREFALDPDQVVEWLQEGAGAEPTMSWCQNWEDPALVSLLPELLEAALDNRLLVEQAASEQMHHRLDTLHDALVQQSSGEAESESESESLRRQKMAALAEFAAGAAHEINNPLAVISGHAQFLLGRETDLDRREMLQKIMKQTQRIHHILTDVLQFARPTQPRKQPTEAVELVRDAAASLQGLATERKVTLRLPETIAPVLLQADREQISRALGALLRNAIEAAAEGGWAGVRIETHQPDTVHFVVEDSGPGPTPDQRDRIFDPFFSGRDAGRGRGLGLPIAWRLARLHHGDVILADSNGGPTCFVLSLPLLPATPSVDPSVNGTPHQISLPLAAIG